MKTKHAILVKYLNTSNMRNKKIKLCVLLLFGLVLIKANAQQATVAAGGNAAGAGGGYVSYSIGQIVYTTNTGATGSLAQGVQQPYDISVVTALEQAIGINLNLAAYPNPTKDFLNLIVENNKTESLYYQLFDINGEILENKKLEGTQTNIVMSNFSQATYFLKVIQDNMELKTFKIIKN